MSHDTYFVLFFSCYFSPISSHKSSLFSLQISCFLHDTLRQEDGSKNRTLRAVGVKLKPLAVTPGLIIQHGSSE